MNRVILFVGGGIEMTPAVATARAMGLRVAVSDRDPHAPGMGLADFPLVASTYDADATVGAARTVPGLAGCLAVGHDVPGTVAAVQVALGLPAMVTPEQARLVSDKLELKAVLTRHGIPVPGQARTPWICIKPSDGRGARGVSRIKVQPWDGEGFDAAVEQAREASPTGRVMAEGWLDGPQVSAESIVYDGRVATFLSDRNYGRLDELAPHVVEDGGDLPSALPRDVQEEMHGTMCRVARALGVERGTFKADLVWHDGQVWVVQMTTGRLSGGYFCTHEIPLCYGYDFVAGAIRLALGEPPLVLDGLQVPRGCVCQRYLFADRDGVVKSVSGLERAGLPGVQLVDVRVGAGDRVRRARCHPDRLGCVIAVGDSRREARERCEAAVGAIEVKIVED